MRIKEMSFSINSGCEIIADKKTIKDLVNFGYASKIVHYFEGGLKREFFTLNTNGIKNTTTYPGHLEDIPDTPLWSKARDLISEITQKGEEAKCQ